MIKYISSKWKVFKTFFKNYGTIGILIIIGILLTWHYHFIGSNLISKGDINLFSLNGVNLIILVISYLYLCAAILFGFVLLLTLVLKIVSKEIKFIERSLLDNLSSICFILVISIITFKIQNPEKITIELLLTTVGAIIVFWYGYKTYERDKEIEVIEKYSEKYNTARINIQNINGGGEKSYTELLSIWYEEYFLYQKGYISDELWNEWYYWISEDIHNFLIEAHRNYISKSIKDESNGADIDYLWTYCFDSSKFLDDYLMNYIYEGIIKNGRLLYKDKFSKFITLIIASIIKKMEVDKDFLHYNEDWLKGMNQFLDAK